MVAVAALIPQLPTITVVTPWLSFGKYSGMRITLISSWVCTSIKPGASTRPWPSITCSAATSSAGAIAIIRSPFTATSARYCGPPLPSITVTFLKSQSTFIAITPFRHADKLTIYKRKKQWKTTQKSDRFVILLFKTNNIFILKIYLSNSYK
ncbi:hypothetical protein [Klebsiella pneumoniae IS10]|nr:hypothetical protein [Klebsiella pneumoniae IS10]